MVRFRHEKPFLIFWEFCSDFRKIFLKLFCKCKFRLHSSMIWILLCAVVPLEALNNAGAETSEQMHKMSTTNKANVYMTLQLYRRAHAYKSLYAQDIQNVNAQCICFLSTSINKNKAQLARQYPSEIMTMCIFARIWSLCTHLCALYSTVYG